MKVKKWVSYDDFNFAPAECNDEEIKAVVRDIYKNGYKFGGDDHENMPNCCPLLSNGKVLKLSWRSWGKIMAMAYDLKTEDGEYNYILWYMGEYGIEERKYPSRSEIRLNEFPVIEEFVYEVSKEEYESMKNPFLSALTLPLENYYRKRIYTFYKIIFKYEDKVILETIVNTNNFSICTVDNFVEKNEFDSSMSEYTNFKGFSKDELICFLNKKYQISNEKLIMIYFDIVNDNRNEFVL